MKIISALLKLILDIIKFKSPFEPKETKVDWKNHVIFRKFKEWRLEVPDMNIPPLKSVFKDILLINLSTWEKRTLGMLETFKERKFSSEAEFKDFVLDNYDDALSKFKVKCLEEGIPKEILTKFEQWHSDKAGFVRDRTKDIATSCFHKDFPSKLDSIFILWSTAIVFTINDAEKTIKNINGSLDASFRKYNNLKNN